MAASADKQRLKELIAQRDALEHEAAAISSRLTAPGQPGIQGSLIDKEGYPRADIDVAAIRGDRHRLACLNTDHRQLSTQIEGLLVQVHAAAKAEIAASGPDPLAPPTPAPLHEASGAEPAAPAAPSRAPAGAPEPQAAAAAAAGPSHMDVDTVLASLPASAPSSCLFQGLIVFAVVDEVSEGSPAAAAGIQVGDRVCGFGDIRAGPQGGELQRIAQALGSLEGSSVTMTVLRQGQPMSLTLVPQRWTGRGLLGCHLQPLKP